MNKYVARSILVGILVILTLPTYYVKVYLRNTFIADHHTRLVFAIWDCIAVMGVIVGGIAVCTAVVFGLAYLFKTAFP